MFYIFDLGNVVIDFELTFGLRPIFPHLSDLQLKVLWQRTPMTSEWETGVIPTEVFFLNFRKFWSLDCGREFLDLNFSNMIRGWKPKAFDAIRECRKKTRTVCLSNTVPTHWNVLNRDFHLRNHFDNCYASCELGLRKPSVDCFQLVLDKEGWKADSVTLFDDRMENITSFKKMGGKAFLVSSPDEILSALRSA
jgi:FMN phosphatase YigB (HAD superfamily)